MDEKKPVKINLSTFFLVLAIIVIIVMGYFIYKLNTEKTVETEKNANLNNEVSNLQSTVNSLNEKINNISNIVSSSHSSNENTTSNTVNNNISNTTNNTNLNKYIEMTEDNYKKYDTSPYSYRIQEMIDNGNKTITIKGRVYTYNEKASANIEEEFGVYNGTDIYLEITLPDNLDCKLGDSITTIRSEYDERKSNGTLIVKDEDNITAPLSNDEFYFKNGKCTSIWFSNI